MWTSTTKFVINPQFQTTTNIDLNYKSVDISYEEQSCLHDSCPNCHGTGKGILGPCIHNLACFCPKCCPR